MFLLSIIIKVYTIIYSLEDKISDFLSMGGTHDKRRSSITTKNDKGSKIKQKYKYTTLKSVQESLSESPEKEIIKTTSTDNNVDDLDIK